VNSKSNRSAPGLAENRSAAVFRNSIVIFMKLQRRISAAG
jgi:hypothetical protein